MKFNVMTACVCAESDHTMYILWYVYLGTHFSRIYEYCFLVVLLNIGVNVSLLCN